MEKLILLSDLWGVGKSDWVHHYTSLLQNHFNIEYYDCCELGQIDLSDYSEDNLHHQFINRGIDKAIETLLAKEKEQVHVLGFSVAGYIAWRACNEGLKIRNLTAISTTRLRYENKHPACTVNLLYGENDPNIPENVWFKKLGINKIMYKNEDHNFYTKHEIAIGICNKIISNRNTKY